MKNKLKVCSLFSGCGGLDYGFYKSGYDIVFSLDNYQRACETYELNLNIALNARRYFTLLPVRTRYFFQSFICFFLRTAQLTEMTAESSEHVVHELEVLVRKFFQAIATHDAKRPSEPFNINFRVFTALTNGTLDRAYFFLISYKFRCNHVTKNF